MEKNQNTRQKKTKVTLPISDTVPGPGSYTVEVLNLNGEGLPVVNAIDLIETTGAGTAKDVNSVSQVPSPGKDNAETN